MWIIVTWAVAWTCGFWLFGDSAGRKTSCGHAELVSGTTVKIRRAQHWTLFTILSLASCVSSQTCTSLVPFLCIVSLKIWGMIFNWYHCHRVLMCVCVLEQNKILQLLLPCFIFCVKTTTCAIKQELVKNLPPTWLWILNTRSSWSVGHFMGIWLRTSSCKMSDQNCEKSKPLLVSGDQKTCNKCYNPCPVI